MKTNFAETDAYPVDGRGVAYSMGYFSAKHLGSRPILPHDHHGQGRQAFRRRQYLSPERACRMRRSSYTGRRRLTIATTHGLIRDTAWSSRSSNTRGCRRTPMVRWISTSGLRPGRQGIELGPDQRGRKVRSSLRLYGPEKPLFERLGSYRISRK